MGVGEARSLCRGRDLVGGCVAGLRGVCARVCECDTVGRDAGPPNLRLFRWPYRTDNCSVWRAEGSEEWVGVGGK